MDNQPIAVVGLSFRFGGDASSTDGFWKMITEGRSARSPVPASRFNADAFYHPDTNRLENLPVNKGNFVTEDIAAFDAPFFSIRAQEAAAMDPQSRKLLETTYRALENAGIPAEKCAGTKTCVFTGISSDDYRLMYNRDTTNPIRHAATGMALSMLANKISWFYDFKGPSVQLDTACSASLNALHLACRSIRSGESEMGIVGGANLFFYPESMSPLAHLNFFSPDATCHSFDHRANGYCRGEGFGILVLKPLAKALADGDPIRAVIRATGSNENGRAVGGITKVSFEAQRSLVASTYQSADLDPSLTRYVEAHAPGTEGDQVETRALASVFKEHRSAEDPLYMGSVKANLGHLEGTSGIASLVKVVLMLERGVIPKIANFEKLHPNIPGEDFNMAFPSESIQWPDGIRRASINSFGFGGANAHVVIENADHHITAAKPSKPLQFTGVTNHGVNRKISNGMDGVNGVHTNGINGHHHIDVEHQGESERPLLLVLSAADEQGVERMKVEYDSLFGKESDLNIKQVAFTLSSRRTRLPWKSFAAFRGHQAALELSKPTRSINAPRLAFAFTGQGAQWARMGIQFLGNKIFSNSLSRCAQYFKELGASWDLLEELSKSEDESRINGAEFSQPICTALQIATVDLLRSYGVESSLAVGHSSGEIAAAYASGAVSVKSACRIAFYRGLVISEHFSALSEAFGMLVVGLPVADVTAILEKDNASLGLSRVSIACVNSPKNVTLSGPLLPLEALRKELEPDSVFLRILPVPAPYHSPILNDVAPRYEALLGGLERGNETGATQMISSVTTKPVSANELLQARYWVQNLVSTVQFAPAVSTLLQHEPLHAVVEIGPSGALRSAIRDTVTSNPPTTFPTYLNVMDKKKASLDRLFDTLGHLHCLGFPIDLESVNGLVEEDKVCLTNLPEYPFDHSKAYWHESQVSRDHRFRKHGRNDLLGTRVLNWNPLAPRWRNTIRTLENPWIEDHQIAGALIYPGAGMIVMAIEAAAQYVSDYDARRPAGFMLQDVSFLSALNLSLQEAGTSTEISLTPIDASGSNNTASRKFAFQLTLLDGEQWREVCTGKVTVELSDENSSVHMKTETKLRNDHRVRKTEDLLAACTVDIRRQKLYGRFRETGLQFGPTFQVFDDVKYDWRGGLASAQIRLRNWHLKGKPEYATPHFIHPTALDGVLQLPVVSLGAGVGRPVPTMVPSHLDSLWINADILSHGGSSDHISAVAKADYLGFRNTKSEISVLSTTDGQVMIHAEGLETIIIEAEGALEEEKTGQPFYHMSWKPDIEAMTSETLKEYCTNSLRSVSGEQTLLVRLVDLILHQNSEAKMLEIAPLDLHDMSKLFLRDIWLSGDEHRGYYDLATRGENKQREVVDEQKAQAVKEPAVLRLSDLLESASELSQDASYDLILTDIRGSTESEASLSELETLVRSNGRVLVISSLPLTSPQLPTEVEMNWSNDVITMLKKPSSTTESQQNPVVITLAPSVSARTVALAKEILGRLHSSGRKCTLEHWDDKKEEERLGDEETVFISGVDDEEPFNVGLNLFKCFKELVAHRKSILWISTESSAAASDIATGVARSVRNERRELKLSLVSMAIESMNETDALQHASTAVLHAYEKHITDSQGKETEYALTPTRDGARVLKTPRLRYSPEISSYVNDRSHLHTKETRQFIAPGKEHIKLTITTPGLLETLTFVPDTTSQALLEKYQVLIQPAYTGLNFLDVLTALGRIPQISVLGVEAAGTITAAGASTDFQIGDRVVVLTDGTLRSSVRADYRTAARIPDNISFRDAASMPGTACTVYRALVDIADLQCDEKILIHAGAGATGQMAIQLAQYLGAEVFVTVGSDSKRELVEKTYGIPTDHIFHTRDSSFVLGMKRVTNGYGVDVVLNSLSGELLETGWAELMAPFGRWVELGKKDILDNKGLGMRPLLNNVSFSCVDLSGIWRHRPTLMRRLLNDVFKLVSEGVIKPVNPLTEFSIGQVEYAFRSLQGGKIGGKVVINMDENDQVVVNRQVEKEWTFQAEKSYLLVGGFGGIAKTAAKWMVQRGAKNLILLSRTGAGSDLNRLALLEELRNTGCVVEQVVCDVSDSAALDSALKDCQSRFPPISGCIQASMVLQDQYFDNMSEDEWKISTSSKIRGSWNLDRLLPKELDFFIFFSSLVGVVGGQGQANYSAGNAFQDSLAIDRVSRGEKAVSFDLGMVVGEGAVAEDEHLARTLESFGFYEPTTMHEVVMLLERYCNPELPILDPEEAQIVLGIRSPAALEAAGYSVPRWLSFPMFTALNRVADTIISTTNSDAAQQDRSAFKAAKTLQEAGATVVQALVKKLSNALGIPIADVDSSRAVHLYGVDSLIALELRNWFTNEFKADVTVLQILGNITIDELGMRVAEESSYTKALKV